MKITPTNMIYELAKPQKRQSTKSSFYKTVQRYVDGWVKWHDPMRVPDRREVTSLITNDWQLGYNDAEFAPINGVEAYITLVENMVANGINCRMEANVLAVGQQYAFISDRHTWWVPGEDEPFVSDRTDVLEACGDRISKTYVISHDPDHFRLWWSQVSGKFGA